MLIRSILHAPSQRPFDSSTEEHDKIIGQPMPRGAPDSQRSLRSYVYLYPWTAGIVVTLLAALLTFPLSSAAQELARRLILKDGSYQLITKYEVKGDRVRYLSAERNEWEEIPKSIVDWPATEKYEKDRAAGASVPEAVQLDKELETEREVDEAKLPQVAPGLRLPEDSGVFLLDNLKGEPQLVEVQQSAGDLNRNVKGNIFRGAINPIASAKQTIELEGEHARVRSHVDVPSLYINVEQEPNPSAAAEKRDSAAQSKTSKTSSGNTASNGPQQPQQPEQALVPFDRFRILRAHAKNGKRILGDVKRAVTGKVSQEQQFVKTTISRVAGGWLKLTPTESLGSGEYALVEMEGKEGMNLYVWDFGVDPNGPANANSWKPEAKTPQSTRSNPD